MTDPYPFAPWVSEEAAALFRVESQSPQPASSDIAVLRQHYDAFNRRHLDVALAHYPVTLAEDEIAGVGVHIVDPQGGVTNDRLLLCLHGGGFMWGRGAGALLEAIPVAATTGSRVVAVEYALAPEQRFPAATEDVVAVFHALSERTAPARIGLYGCSAGGMLTAQTVARLIADGAALPGAIAMLHGTGLELAGDSIAISRMLSGQTDGGTVPALADWPYFAGSDLTDRTLLPGAHPELLARFPPSLLVTGTRDFFAGAVSTMHRRLLSAGATADLLHFDGMWHAHHMATTLPEARETFAALARHFGAHLR